MYTRVESTFWTDDKMRAVSEDARTVMFYILTSPHRNILGCYRLPIPYACHDLQWSQKRFRKAFGELLPKPFGNGRLVYDEKSEVVLIRRFLFHDPITNGNQAVAAEKELALLPYSEMIFIELAGILKALGKAFMEALGKALAERLRKGNGKPDSDSDSDSDKPMSAPKGTDAPSARGKNQKPHQLISAEKKKKLFTFWISECDKGPPAPAFTNAREELLNERLDEGYSMNDLAKAIKGCAFNPHNQGQNDRGTKYMGWELIMRSAEKVDHFIESFKTHGGGG